MTAGQAGDAPSLEAVLAGIRVPRLGPGRPRVRPNAVLADRAYSSRAVWSHLRRRGIRAVIPQPSDQVGPRGRRGHASRNSMRALASRADPLRSCPRYVAEHRLGQPADFFRPRHAAGDSHQP
ncbi:hypothetical protein [Streptomyces sp. NPDC005494]|uniref:hypothetical protein n=1 Tax=Streptomyces sp. NPDC005494 TaxID=3364715 RepID=UPI0036B053DC